MTGHFYCLLVPRDFLRQLNPLRHKSWAPARQSGEGRSQAARSRSRDPIEEGVVGEGVVGDGYRRCKVAPAP